MLFELYPTITRHGFHLIFKSVFPNPLLIWFNLFPFSCSLGELRFLGPCATLSAGVNTQLHLESLILKIESGCLVSILSWKPLQVWKRAIGALDKFGASQIWNVFLHRGCVTFLRSPGPEIKWSRYIYLPVFVWYPHSWMPKDWT